MNYDRVIKWTDGRSAKIQIATDITDLKNMEKELHQAHKMEAIGTLAGGIAHDFNNILSAIIGFSELAMDEAQQGSLLEANLQEVFTAGKRAKELVRQILTFVRQSDEALKPLMVRAIAKEALRLIRSSIPTTIEIYQTLASDAMVMGSPTQVHQVIMNLCTNAAHAMEAKGGILSVALVDEILDKVSMPPQLTLNPGNYIKLSVCDTGVGITPEILESIFEPYFTTKVQGAGTGMGLAVVQGIVESYGGKVMVTSKPGKGTDFTVYLPVCGTRHASETQPIENIEGGKERILFIDDELPVVKMGGLILQRLGYQVTTKSNSMEALAAFRANPDQFDLVITDMTMPKMTGDALAVEMMAIRPDIPVILFTGYSKAINEETALKLGIKAFTFKPIVKKELAALVRNVFGVS